MTQIQFEKAQELKRGHEMKLLSEAAKFVSPDEREQMKDYKKYEDQLLDLAKQENHAKALGEHAKWLSDFSATKKEMDNKLAKMSEHSQMAMMKQTTDDMDRVMADVMADTELRRKMGKNYRAMREKQDQLTDAMIAHNIESVSHGREAFETPLTMKIGGGSFDLRSGVQGFGEKPTQDPNYVQEGATPKKVPPMHGWSLFGRKKADASPVSAELQARQSQQLSPILPEYIEQKWKDEHPTGLKGWMKGFGEGAKSFGEGVSALASAGVHVVDAVEHGTMAPLRVAKEAIGLSDMKDAAARVAEGWARGKVREDAQDLRTQEMHTLHKTREEWEQERDKENHSRGKTLGDFQLERDKASHSQNMTRAQFELRRERENHERGKKRSDWDWERDKDVHRENMATASQNRTISGESHKKNMAKADEDLSATKRRNGFIEREKENELDRAELDKAVINDKNNIENDLHTIKKNQVWWNNVGSGFRMAGGAIKGAVMLPFEAVHALFRGRKE
jgi:hypothetical protein